MVKKRTSGMAIRITSNGKSTIISPFKLNMITIVKSRAISVIGETKGINFFFFFLSHKYFFIVYLFTTANANGIPK